MGGDQPTVGGDPGQVNLPHLGQHAGGDLVDQSQLGLRLGALVGVVFLGGQLRLGQQQGQAAGEPAVP